MVPTDTDLAWAAGFIDGEGHIGINMAGDSTQMAVSVSNTDLRSIKRFAELFGGKLHYTTPGTGGKRPVHYWRAAGHGAAGVLRQVYPYLVIKKEQADVAFDYAATLLPPGKRGLDLSTRETRAALMYRLRSIRKAG